LNRRLLLNSSAAAAVWAALDRIEPLLGVPQSGEQVIPFADVRPPNPDRPTLQWGELTSWLTPKEQFFAVSHYGFPKELGSDWRLGVSGLVNRPLTLSLDQLKARPRREMAATIECSGNGPTGGLIANERWVGTPLAPILKEAGLKPGAIEAVFFAADTGTEKIRNNDYPQNFVRSLSVEDAMRREVLLCYSMNGEPLDHKHGAPVRLVVPGAYGICWVKWLTRIELHDRRFMGKFMGRDYVTIRGEKQGDQTIWRETSVGRMNLKSIAARVTRQADGSYRVTGAAWTDGTPLTSVELRINDGPWQSVKLEQKPGGAPFTWTLWSHEWRGAKPGEHTLTSRATDAKGRRQPAADDPSIAMKKTYWEANQQATRKITL